MRYPTNQLSRPLPIRLSPQTSPQQQGFTLIELVAVIAIIGILAAVAVPRYVDMSRSSRVAVLQSLHGAIVTAASQTKVNAALVGVADQRRSSTSNPPHVIIDGRIMELKYGYPEAYADSSGTGDLLDLLDLSDNLQVCYSSGCISTNSSRVKIGFDTTEGSGCYVRYSEPGGTGSPSATQYGLIIVDDGC